MNVKCWRNFFSLASVSLVLVSSQWENGLSGFTVKAQETLPISQSEKIVSGILKKWDLKEQQGMIVTALGEPIFFDIPEQKTLMKLSQGQRVTAKFDLQGRLITIIETPVPELKHSLP